MISGLCGFFFWILLLLVIDLLSYAKDGSTEIFLRATSMEISSSFFNLEADYSESDDCDYIAYIFGANEDACDDASARGTMWILFMLLVMLINTLIMFVLICKQSSKWGMILCITNIVVILLACIVWGAGNEVIDLADDYGVTVEMSASWWMAMMLGIGYVGYTFLFGQATMS